MKKMILSAGAFLLSSSALVGVVHANSASDAYWMGAPVVANSSAWAMNPMLQHAVVDAGTTHVHTVQTDWMADHGKANSAAVDALYGEFDSAMSYQEAAAWTGDKNAQVSAAHAVEKQNWLANSGAQTDMAADMGKAGDVAADASGGTNTGMAADMSGKTADAGGSWTGQGGPDEAGAASDQSMLPACRPGPGDDRCIQLYERGVRGAFAQWSAGRSRMAMGGPEEPAPGKDAMASADTSMTSNMSGSGKAETSTDPAVTATGTRAEGKTAMTADMSAPVDQGATSKSAGPSASVDQDNMAHNGMTAEQMQANSAWSAQANRT